MGAGKTILIILLTLIAIPFFILGNMFMAINLSYSLENIQNNAKPIVENALPTEEQNITINQVIGQACTEREQLNLMSASIPCSEINQKTAFKNAISYIYNKDYNCNFIDCYSGNNQAVIISEKTNENLSKISWILIGIILIFLLLYFAIFKRNSNFMIFSGIILIIFSSTSLIIKQVAKSQMESLPLPTQAETGGTMMKNALEIFFGSSGTVMTIWILIGIGLIIGAIAIKYLNKKDKKGNEEIKSTQERSKRD